MGSIYFFLDYSLRDLFSAILARAVAILVVSPTIAHKQPKQSQIAPSKP
jgi:hypothetical protein